MLPKIFNVQKQRANKLFIKKIKKRRKTREQKPFSWWGESCRRCTRPPRMCGERDKRENTHSKLPLSPHQPEWSSNSAGGHTFDLSVQTEVMTDSRSSKCLLAGIPNTHTKNIHTMKHTNTQNTYRHTDIPPHSPSLPSYVPAHPEPYSSISHDQHWRRSQWASL